MASHSRSTACVLPGEVVSVAGSRASTTGSKLHSVVFPQKTQSVKYNILITRKS